jgi:hypothetical protein
VAIEPPAANEKPAAIEKPAEMAPKPRHVAPQRRDSGNRTVGLGDHLPSFIALSFEERSAD